MSEEIYQHFRKEERVFIDLVEKWMTDCFEQYSPILTNFLDPRQQFIAESVLGQNDEIAFQFEGGYLAAERKRCLIYPSYYTPNFDDFECQVVEILYPKKFAELGHGRILGSLMGLGLERDVFGDIISDGERWQIFYVKEINDYLKQQFDKVGNIKVRLDEADYTDIITPKDQWTLTATTVSSLRLDTVIASIFNISRQRTKQLIEANKVKVNWTLQERSDFTLDVLDIISIRGFGRIQIRNIIGKTKKDKIRLEIGLLDKNKQ
ncbi:RNA-binding protein YlmH, contains S4-like domain [Granulicatella balaenopterae]|uniref:RNA-binding protein YlmH, contains S4-like domain n=1 Tax=Granulicatella balaenopterae TaxID=137733 RepID=A0A1H9IC16_9LACT|nr:RNA-binding protein [Granulicatella balaenopterae]SEQ72086.1 RNA-binding protein YlmH, contains S4-like domain [Granulicatella balaenopterae]